MSMQMSLVRSVGKTVIITIFIERKRKIGGGRERSHLWKVRTEKKEARNYGNLYYNKEFLLHRHGNRTGNKFKYSPTNRGMNEIGEGGMCN